MNELTTIEAIQFLMENPHSVCEIVMESPRPCTKNVYLFICFWGKFRHIVCHEEPTIDCSNQKIDKWTSIPMDCKWTIGKRTNRDILIMEKERGTRVY